MGRYNFYGKKTKIFSISQFILCIIYLTKYQFFLNSTWLNLLIDRYTYIESWQRTETKLIDRSKVTEQFSDSPSTSSIQYCTLFDRIQGCGYIFKVKISYYPVDSLSETDMTSTGTELFSAKQNAVAKSRWPICVIFNSGISILQ